MSTPTTEIADVAIASGLPDDHPIKDLPGLTFHVWKPLEKNDPPITTIGDLKGWTDATLVQIAQFGATRLDKLKTAMLTAFNGPTF
ncbi:hypothetical protein [Nonomuraea candida]|uniref:hypothetical protein n=1 Tax=Nonomuraea candida TaxID=359159 RepID=UPI0005BC5977|nr:hypothetical protein [Nonomuraea candida]